MDQHSIRPASRMLNNEFLVGISIGRSSKIPNCKGPLEALYKDALERIVTCAAVPERESPLELWGINQNLKTASVTTLSLSRTLFLKLHPTEKKLSTASPLKRSSTPHLHTDCSYKGHSLNDTDECPLELLGD